jgi:hypothetical protein
LGASWRHSRKLQDEGSLVQVLIQIVIHRLCHRKSGFFVEPDGREVVSADMEKDFVCTGRPEVLQDQRKGSPAKAFSSQFFIYLEVIEAGGSAFLQANPYVLWYALSHGIPAESFAAGANPVPKWGATVQGNILKQVGFKQGVIHNVDMASNCIPNKKGVEVLPWIHSYFIENSLFDTAILYEALTVQIGSTKLNNPGKGESNE